MAKDKKESFLTKIFNFLLGGGNDPEKEKKRILKGLEDQLRKRGKLYHVSSKELMPTMGKFFFDIYTVITPASMLLKNLAKSDQLKGIVIESFLDEGRKQMLVGFSPENIKKRATEQSISSFQTKLKQELHAVTSYLENSSMAGQINLTYAYMRAFSDFINYDYYHIVKQFDAEIPEKNLNYKPRFEACPAVAIVDDIADFLHICLPVAGELNWDKIFDILKDYRNTEIINRDAWRKIMINIREMLKSETLELIIRTIKEDPFYESKNTINTTDVVRPYIAKLKTQINGYIKQLGDYEKNKAVTKILSEIFGTATLAPSLLHYNQTRNEALFTNKNSAITGFIYADALNVLMSFYENFLVKDIKVLVDLLLLKGKWSQNLHYKDFSGAFQELLASGPELKKFDSSLADESSYMVRLRNALRAGDRDKFAVNTVKGILNEINDAANDFISQVMQHYIIIARCLKSYIEDFKLQPKSEVIINWKEIEKASEKPLGRFMADVYTKIYYLIQMLQYAVKEE